MDDDRGCGDWLDEGEGRLGSLKRWERDGRGGRSRDNGTGIFEGRD
jgi:hypothetical protein